MTARPSTQAENEAALVLAGVIDARLRRDQTAANVLLHQQDLALVLQAAIELLATLLPAIFDNPGEFTGHIRSLLINAMANGSPQ